MNKRESKTNNRETASLPTCLRIKDRHGHFLCEVQGSLIRIYCKRCKEFFEVPINQLVVKNLKGL